MNGSSVSTDKDVPRNSLLYFSVMLGIVMLLYSGYH